jgi:GNAT superfamily N-acetyltransferase
MEILSVREHPEIIQRAADYIHSKWGSEKNYPLYLDCISHSGGTVSKLPNWYLLTEGEMTLGCAGLISNDFISRMDLFPWLCSLYIEKEHRGRALGSLLIERIKRDAVDYGFSKLYLCTDHIGYYEKYGFEYIGTGYHPWGESSRIYETGLPRDKAETRSEE